MFLFFPLNILYAQQEEYEFKSDDFKINRDYKRQVRTELSATFLHFSDVGDVSFLDKGHADYGRYVLNGNIIPHFYVTPPHWPFMITLSPIVKVRIFKEQFSKPVRTPSFIPGGTLFFNIRKDRNYNKPVYLSLGVFHHSNGQDGEPIVNDTINTYNGNFSTNFASFDFHLGRLNRFENYHSRVGIELHSGLLEFGDEPAYRDKFSKARLNYQFMVIFLRNKSLGKIIKDVFVKTLNESDTLQNTFTEEKSRIIIEGMFALDDIQRQNAFNIEAKLYVKIPESENTAVFLGAGYFGHDNYNIYFNKPYGFFRVGLSASNVFKYSKKMEYPRRE